MPRPPFAPAFGSLRYVLSVEDAGIYKPAPPVHRLAAERLGLGLRTCGFVVNAWDAAGAARFGFRVAWINRFKQQPERLPFDPHVEVQSLANLPELLTSRPASDDLVRRKKMPDRQPRAAGQRPASGAVHRLPSPLTLDGARRTQRFGIP
jgi:hypothetical protein